MVLLMEIRIVLVGGLVLFVGCVYVVLMVGLVVLLEFLVRL